MVDHKKVLSSFRLKTILTVFIACLLLAVTSLIYMLVSRIFGQFSPAVRDDLAWKAVRGAREISEAAELGIAIADRAAILDALGDYRSTADVESVTVVDVAGRVLARHGQPARPPEILFSGPEGTAQSGPSFLWAWGWSAIEGKAVGRVAVVISIKRLEASERLRRRLLQLVAAGCVAALAASLFFVSFYLGPLLRFAERTLADLRGLNATLEDRVDKRTAELRNANARLQDSLQEIRVMQRQMVDASRKAGMADVATAVLHNVGNVLNSVNVSAGVVTETVGQSRLAGLDKAVALMNDHRGDLGRFFVEDDKGKRLPTYFEALCKAAREERGIVLGELESLQKNIDHIKVIVARQQAHARSTVGFVESVSARELLEDAISFKVDSFAKHEIQFMRELTDLPPIAIDRHKFFEILVNLLSNAHYATRDVQGERRITVRLEPRGATRFAIVIEDTGCGIAAENIERIFSYGFTTKEDGHGFGLHGSALAANEMGGSLVAHSDGPGKGARFTLELPTTPRQVIADSRPDGLSATG